MTGSTSTYVPGLDGLSAAEVQQRVERGQVNDIPHGTSRTIGEIIRANVFTRFNVLLGILVVVVLFVAPIQDALFGFVLVANASIGIVQELRAKQALDRLALLSAPRARVVRQGAVGELAINFVVLDDVLDLQPGDRLVEVGAGTGGTTAHVLPALPRDAVYTLTDLSRTLLGGTAERLSHPGLVTAVLSMVTFKRMMANSGLLMKT